MMVTREIQFGDRGDDVLWWQQHLIADGYEIGTLDGDFGRRTHNATLAWQRARGVPRAELGRVGRWTLEAIGEDPAPATMRGLVWPHIPFVEAANWQRDVGEQVKRLIVLHTIEAPEASTSADRTADWFAGKRGPAPRTSAHVCIDDDSIVQCVPWRRIAWAAPGANKQGIHLEHAGYARQTDAEWHDDFSQRMLQRSSWVAARLCEQEKIPIAFVTAQGLLAEMPGITTHYEVSQAFKKSDHWDPGPHFPIDEYLDLVRRA